MRGLTLFVIAIAVLGAMSAGEAIRSVDERRDALEGSGAAQKLSSPTAEINPPRIDRLLPSTIAAGESLEILGAGFTEDSVVFLGKRPLAIESLSPTRLRVRIPDPATSGVIVLRNANGESRFEGLSVVPYYPSPKIESFSPDAVQAGGLLHVRGSGFGEENRALYLSIGGEMAEIIERRDDRLIVRVPEAARTGTLILVVARGGQAIAQLPVRIIARELEAASKK